MMSNDMTSDDEGVLRLLREVFEPNDRERERLVSLAMTAWEWRNPDQEIGQLIEDSLESAGGLRSSESNERSMLWQWPTVSMELLGVTSGQIVTVQGVISTEAPTSEILVTSVVDLERYTQTVKLDEGMFSFATNTSRLIAISTVSGGVQFSTDWFRM
jgi:hypothetical protein